MKNFTDFNIEKLLLEHAEMINIGRLKFLKPLAIIVNPSSGKKRDVRCEISDFLK